MGYYIRKLKTKNQNPRWKVQFISYKKQYTGQSNAKKPRKDWDISKRRWIALGFKDSMSLEQARARARQINAKIEMRRQEERRKQIEEEQFVLEQKFTAALPDIYKEEFEQRYLVGRYKNPGWQKRFLTCWRATQRMLTELQIDPVDWNEDAHLFDDYFQKKSYSFSYIKKILLVTNLWGHFLSRRLGQNFMRIPSPRGTEKARLLDAYFGKRDHRLTPSDPITPRQLAQAKHKFKKEQYNWLYLSVWLGLRPQEVDQLKNPQMVRLQNSTEGTPTLWIYQTKLVSVPHRYRWKLIPIIFKEQKKALHIVRSKNFQRPIVRTVKKHFGAHTTLYGGRKGFTDLMLSHQQNLFHISQWMGHSSIERTWKNYKSRCIAHHLPTKKPV